MDISTTKKNLKTSNIIVISLALIILILFFIIFQITYTILNSDTVYKGVYIDNIKVEGLTLCELKDVLQNKYSYEKNNVKLTFATDNFKKKYSLGDLSIAIDIDATANSGFIVGREGNIFDRLLEIFYANLNDINIAPETTFDEIVIRDIIDSFYDKTFVPVKSPEITFNENDVIIDSGHHGESIDKAKLYHTIMEYVEGNKNTKFEIPLVIKQQEKFHLESLYESICTEPLNATVRVSNNELTVVPHKVGRAIDKSLLEKALLELNKEEDRREIVPITLIEPKITEQKLRENMFRDTLGTYKTYYSTESQYNIDRNENLRLALDCIDGITLAPGDTFSFDKTLGERTAEKGYKSAKVFSGGKIVDAVGGGICQVSSTLYNAVLYSDLEILERHNHSFIVNYVPAGYDATVAHQIIDFKFRNSTDWPIKIKGRTTPNNELIIAIEGTNNNLGKMVEYYTEIVKTTEYNTVYVDDPNILEGKLITRQEGINGYIVDTYKIIKQDGKEISRYKISTSIYIPLNKEVIRGTNTTNTAKDEEQIDLPPIDDDNLEEAAGNHIEE
jgi:vancomycin resistance protein YoaR